MSASNSHELLLNLNNGQLLPLRVQGPLAPWIPSFSGLPLQQQAPIPGQPQISLPALNPLAGLLPNELPFPRQVGFAQGAQTGQLDAAQLQTPSQATQGPNPVMPYVYPFKPPQEQAQVYYPVYMLLPWEQYQQTATQSPQQTGPPLFEEQIPFDAQYGYITQPEETGVPGGQQQFILEPLLGTAPETVLMPGGEVIPFLQKEVVNFRHDKAEVLRHSTSPKPSTATVFTSGVDTTTASMLAEQKAKTDSLREP
ncbi:odontogenic ameloblast-associated protein [Cavia porcellus]|uniref:odontogenic ameloblast-associated protein n=1 Tax=Cavia porcellus TaxID=10141 RepID=UPI002FE299F6